MKWLGSFLCNIRFHNWTTEKMLQHIEVHTDFGERYQKYMVAMRCLRCGARKVGKVTSR